MCQMLTHEFFLSSFNWSNSLSLILALECVGWNKNIFSKHCFNNFLDLNNDYNKDVLPLQGFPINKVVEWQFKNLVNSYSSNFLSNLPSHKNLQCGNIGLLFFF